MAKTRVGSISSLFYKKVAGHLPLIQDASQRVGNVYYVDSGDGVDDTAHGVHPDSPFATIDYAIGRCTANQGDVIFVLPGHTETIAAAAGIDADIAGISIIGLGHGVDRPTVTFATAAGADIDIDAASITFKNIVFVCNIDEQTIMIDVNSTDALIEDCEFRGSATAQPLDIIDINGGADNACDRATIRRCKFISYTAAATANEAIELGRVAAEVLIEDCVIDGDWGNAGIHNPIGAILTNLRILHNVVRNRQSGDHAIELVSACTGEAIGNSLFGDTAGAIFDPGSLFTAGNKIGTAIDQESLAIIALWPAAAAAGNGASVEAVLRYLEDALIGTAGVVTFPAAAAPANGVSLAEVIRSIYDRQLGDGTNASTNSLLGKRVNRTTADLFSGVAIPIFNVTGGRVLVTQIIIEVTTIIQAQITNFKLLSNPTTGTTVDLCANLDINADEVGTLYTIAGAPGTALQRGESGSVPGMGVNGVVVAVGAIEAISSVDSTGSASAQIWYIPLDDGAAIAAA